MLVVVVMVVGLEEEGGIVAVVRLGRVSRSGGGAGAGGRRGGRVEEEVGQGHGVEEGRGKAAASNALPVHLGGKGGRGRDGA
jgi:hypothetical protein